MSDGRRRCVTSAAHHATRPTVSAYTCLSWTRDTRGVMARARSAAARPTIPWRSSRTSTIGTCHLRASATSAGAVRRTTAPSWTDARCPVRTATLLRAHAMALPVRGSTRWRSPRRQGSNSSSSATARRLSLWLARTRRSAAAMMALSVSSATWRAQIAVTRACVGSAPTGTGRCASASALRPCVTLARTASCFARVTPTQGSCVVALEPAPRASRAVKRGQSAIATAGICSMTVRSRRRSAATSCARARRSATRVIPATARRSIRGAPTIAQSCRATDVTKTQRARRRARSFNSYSRRLL
mmetsp:Transcript_18970/g.59025  ORF Transcript_18970/g.59025 Transcript_18970/m.59025 type:complete len:301 (+) Transcript_18970:3500-4402(+)